MITYQREVTREQAEIEMTLYALERQIGDARKIARDYEVKIEKLERDRSQNNEEKIDRHKQVWQYHMDKTALKRKELEDYKSQLNI